MTTAFVAALALLLFLASVSILWYSRQAAIRNTAAVLRLAARNIKQELQEDHNDDPDDDPPDKGHSEKRQQPQSYSGSRRSDGQESHAKGPLPAEGQNVGEAPSTHSVLARLLHETREAPGARGLAILILNSKRQIVERSEGSNLTLPPNDDWQIATLGEGSRIIVLGMPLDENRRAIRTEALDLLVIDLFVLCASAVGAWLLVGRT
ncbi:MAG: hypothetical protein M3Y56_03515, partial [Armatimonadota bacterium]|nr:hypothetical protein [Armatimonadota bacterium]